MSSSNKQEVDIREIESPTAFYKNIPKVKNAPYVAGLEPERYGQLTPLGHQFADNNDENNNNLDPNSTYYSSSTKTLGFLMILLAFSLFGVWNYIYNQDARYIPTNQQGAQSSYQEASLKEESNNNKKGNNNKNQKSSSSASDQNTRIKTAPDAVGLWANVEFSLDKIRAIETLKGFAIISKDDVMEWISHPAVVDALFQCFAVFVLVVVSVAIARAIPAFMIFCCVGIAVMGWLATLGDLFIVGRALQCFKLEENDEVLMMNSQQNSRSDGDSTTFTTTTVSATGCSFPLIMHAFCVNTKWFCLTLATSILIISVRLRGGLCFGLFKNVINLSVLAGLPICAQALRFYLWYTGLGVVKDAIGPDHGWLLPHHEELIAMSFHVGVLIQIGLWFLFGVALLGQGTLLVLEQELPKEGPTKSEENRSKIKGIDDADDAENQGENENSDEKISAQRSWKTGSEVKAKLVEKTTAKKSSNVEDKKKD